MKPETKERLKEGFIGFFAGLVVTFLFALSGLLISSFIVVMVKVIVMAYASGGLASAFIVGGTLTGGIIGMAVSARDW